MDKHTLLAKLKSQLAIDYSCRPEDFDRDEIVITIPKANPGRRPYSPKPRFFSMATTGSNAVISAEACLHPWLEQWVSGRQGVWLFEENNLSQLEEELRRHGQKLWQSHHMYLPETEPHTPEPGLAVQWYEREEILSLPGKESFPNALGLEPARPDMLAVAAVEEGSIVGLAGCSADTPEFWQIGIDVLPGHRGAGLGGKLVRLLKDEILRRGAIPIYGSGTANLHSQRIAAACGFSPAWVEIESIEKD